MKLFCGTRGRLGNQMFCLAAAHKIAKDNNAELVGYFQIDEYPKPSEYIREKIFYKTNYLDSVNTRGLTVYPSDPNTYYVKDFTVPQKDVLLLNSFFQDMRFIDKDICYNLFGIYDSIKDEILQIYGDLSNYVCVNVRRGDFLGLGWLGFKVLDKKFIMENLEKYFDKSKVLMVSDDIDWCKNNFRDEGFIFADKPCTNKIEMDLYLQTMCGQGNLISNSTFSWWGAYLNPSPNKKVVFSSPWYGKNFLDGGNCIVPDKWIKVEEG